MMAQDNHFKKLENMYLTAPCNEFYVPKIKVKKGAAEITIPIREEFFHAAGATHGSVYFKAMDEAAFFAVNSLIKDTFVLTVNFNVQLIRPIVTGKMKAVGKVLYLSNKYYFAESIVYDSDGREIAHGTGNYVKSAIPLTPEIGYK
jgi:uncharacterized protein (TIGR00369 family)